MNAEIMHRMGIVALAVIGAMTAAAPSVSAPKSAVDLVWHVETLDGTVIDSRRADEPINPASVMKLATTLAALERLGPEERFETVFGTRGTLDLETGVLVGDLVVGGSGDPDFHIENAYLVAEALNASGLREVHGDLLVGEDFWIGWEGGSARRERDPRERSRIMATRLRDALDPRRWDKQTRKALGEFTARREISGPPPRVVVRDGVGPWLEAGLPPGRPLAIHRSNPLATTLKRFNAFSNNDIERLEAKLGTPGDLQGLLAERLPADGGAVRVTTHSGLGSNRMTPRQIVALLHELDVTCRRLGLRIEDLLPVAGCDPGTLKHFPALKEGGLERALAAKTGTLTTTDGGVAVLAGYVDTVRGRRLFAVAGPGIGSRLGAARRAQERWLLDLVGREGGPAPGECGAPVVHSDLAAVARAVSRAGAPGADCLSAETP